MIVILKFRQSASERLLSKENEMVAGLTIVATSLRAFVPSFLPNFARVIRSGSVSLRRPSMRVRRIRFSAVGFTMDILTPMDCKPQPGAIKRGSWIATCNPPCKSQEDRPLP